MPTKVLKKHKSKQKQKQKQRQSQSVVVKIDQSKRVVQRRQQERPQVIQQPAPMNVMIAPPHLSIDEARKRSNVVALEQTPQLATPQNQATQQMTQRPEPPRQTLIPVHVYPPPVDFEEDVPVIVNDVLGASDRFNEAVRASSPLRTRENPATSLGAGGDDGSDEQATLPEEPVESPQAIRSRLLSRDDITQSERNRLNRMSGGTRLKYNKGLRKLNEKYR
jgi:hypothetical protein